MAKKKRTFDVFVSHAQADAALAERIVEACRAAGLEAFRTAQVAFGRRVEEALWEALAESRVLLAIVSPSGPTPMMGIEIGAAKAWNKPIFGVVTDPVDSRVPPALQGITLYSASNVEDVVRAVQSTSQQLNDDERAILAGLYAEIDVSVDQLALEPAHLNTLVRRFRGETGKSVSGERLLSELLRLRKQGALARQRSGSR